jgi:Undecaprenyl-phosphate glucose phosphotransferase
LPWFVEAIARRLFLSRAKQCGRLFRDCRKTEKASGASALREQMLVESERLMSGTSFSEPIARGVQVLLDFGIIMLSSMSCWLVILGEKSPESFQRYLVASLLAAAASVSVLAFSRMYDFDVVTEPQSHLRGLVSAQVATFFGLLFLAFSLGHADTAFSRIWAYSFFVTSIAALLIERVVWARVIYSLARSGGICRNVVIVGTGENAVMLLRSLVGPHNPWVRIIGVFDDRHRRLEDHVEGHRVQGGMADLLEFAKTERIDDIFVALPWTAEMRLFEIFDTLQAIPANVHLSPEILSSRLERATFVPYFGITALRVSKKPIEGWNYVMKWVEDKAIAVLALTILAPVILLVALAIRLESRGPILFKQSRYGFNNKLIEVYKFRSMHDDQRDDNAELQTTRSDDRVTRVGRVIRRTSLDELPQLFNVLKGEMSIVGPRPHATRTKAAGRLFEDVVKEYAARHKIKPGITGWAQVNGWRGETDTEDKIKKRVECDIYYMENWSIMMDLEILVRTVFAVFSVDSAY